MLSTRRLLTVYLLLILLLLVIMGISMCVGTVWISPTEMCRLFSQHSWWDWSANFANDTSAQILFTLRLPRLWMAALVGACLAVAGLIYQQVLRNPLAEPYVLGVSSGAACFTVIGQWLFAGAYLATVLASFVGGLFTILLLLLLHQLQRRPSEVHLLLTGVMLNFFMGAMMMLALFLTRSSNSGDMLYHLMGSFSGLWSWQPRLLLVVLTFGASWLFIDGRALNALSLGEEWAMNLGYAAATIRRRCLIIASLMVALTVAAVGMIGFVGLLVPHLTRRLLPMETRLLLPANILLGASFTMLADTISRQLVLFGTELPVGVISALLGSPLFIWLIVKQLRHVEV
jgi:ABC-type Fe3+-siderophore transport system permease subunit